MALQQYVHVIGVVQFYGMAISLGCNCTNQLMVLILKYLLVSDRCV